MSLRSVLRSAAAVLLVGALTVAPAVTAQATAPLAHLSGDGSAEAPYLVGSAADLDAVASAINTDAAAYGAAHFQLSADIPYAGGTFTGIDRFTGVLDGAGFTISDIVYGPSAASSERALVRALDGGTVRDLGIDGVSAHSEDGQRVAGLAGLAVDAVNGARLTDNSVTDAVLSTGHDYAGGIAATADTKTVISGNSVDASVTSARYPAGVAGYARKSVEITKNLVQAEVLTTGPGAFGGMVVAYAGNASAQLDPVTRIAENVVLAGSVGFSSGGDEVEMGRVVARPRADGFLIENNLAGDAVLINGQVPEGPGDLNKTASPPPRPSSAHRRPEPSNRLQLGRPIETHPYRLFPISDQIAEKVTANDGNGCAIPPR